MGRYDSTDDTLRGAVSHEDYDTVPYVYTDDPGEDKPASPVPAGDVPAVDPHDADDLPHGAHVAGGAAASPHETHAVAGSAHETHAPTDLPYETDETDGANGQPHGLDDRPYEPHEQHASEYSRVVEEAPAPVASPGHDAAIDVESREDSEALSGRSSRLAWGIRSDVGLVRSHNEDSYLARAPLFAVCDGMGGHAAGEVASSIAVQTLAEEAPATADDILLGAAVESANAAVIRGATEGVGKPGMGSTCTCAIIDGNRMAIAHVGDSRLYLLHAGTLVRLTHDHSYVEELVDAGEITADEARVHPSRSVITRALGSDPDMYADHFTLNISAGDRVIICSDGLSGMVEDSLMEAIAVSTATPQQAADSLVSEALAAGGHDNVTVVVVDVLDDGLAETHRAHRMRRLFFIVLAILATLAVLAGLTMLYVSSSWYLGANNGRVAIYHGVNSSLAGIQLSELDTQTSVAVDDLPQTVQEHLQEGISVSSADEARQVVDDYRAQIDADKTNAAQTAQTVSGEDSDAVDSADGGAAAGGDAGATGASATGAINPTATTEGGEA